MGWFGPTVKERSRGGRVEYYGKCDECSNEKSGTNKRDVEKALDRCAKDDKKAKEKAKADEAKQRADEAREAAENKARAEREEREEQARKLKKKLASKAREQRRIAKGSKACPFCGKKPCQGTRPKCAMVKADEYESAANIDVSDPATFYDWARQWKNM